MKVVVCSPSTKKYITDGDEYFIVTEPPKENILEKENMFNDVIAIGGGAVLDVAKIVSKNPIECFPTTAAGSSDTIHSVYWDGERKMSKTCLMPKSVNVVKEYVDSLPEKVVFQTRCDLISHCLDSLWSKNKNSESEFYANKALDMISENNSTHTLVEAGRLGGKAIQITTTNILHALSYPLTGRYNISHGLALSFLIPKISTFMGVTPPKLNYSESLGEVDWDWVIDEAFTYNKISECNKFIDKETIKKLIL